MSTEHAMGNDRIALARRRLDRCSADWRRLRWWLGSSRIAVVALPLAALAARGAGGGVAATLAWTSISLLLAVVIGHRLSLTPARLVAQHLDRRLPELEDSCELLLSDKTVLSPLEELQASRIAGKIIGLPDSSLSPDRSWISPLLPLGIAILTGVIIAGWTASGTQIPTPTQHPLVSWPEKAAVMAVRIDIASPAYSRQEHRRVDGMDLEALEGSRLTWSIETSGQVSDVELAWIHGGSLPAEQVEPRLWRASLELESTFLYEIHLDCGEPSCSDRGPARIGMLADESPVVRILNLPRVVLLETGHAPRLDLDIELIDDFGLSHASLVWTLATGSGESVRFRERRRPIAEFIGAPREQRIEAALDLEEIGLEEGAELYYYVEAFDVREPEALRGRSATHLLRMPGGGSTIQIATLPLDIDLMPRFLRSQRQIILDTEALIAAIPNLEEPDVESRSHALAFDQRALRMRYAALLGDEFSSGQIGRERHDEGAKNAADHEDHVDEKEAGWPSSETSSLGNPGSLLAALPPGFVHMHDSEQSGSMLAGSVQERLRETIAEMFDAERLLAAYDPRAALPAEYRALRKLKEAQEADRLYVRRVGFGASPLDSEQRRFQGELDEIRDRRRERRLTSATDDAFLWQALSALESWLSDDHHPDESNVDAIRQARDLLAKRAIVHDDIPMEGLRALSEIEVSVARSQALTCDNCLQVAIRALRSLLPSPPPQPESRSGLSKLELRYREARP